ncbi:MAG TPA: TetR/AcrR family transcriptional regulator [Thermoclostridium caenicola]|uniref:TetR/AcrR family transcriptional regulator n=1 Tax=Thermoclostridium caenicola TaxID=659425 RepID=UPI002B82D2F6|nr:TetR/AcrR family transcriptional regulator [Thermoclostridium caenicola]HOK42706.1 TetR/AcrR family transcriptional regulator [Thermoclostridium caenicola]HOL84411.1 TetR/AcrR family transcriptional regulator [Thermoclostridium caenicola]HPO75941.1 TetR/AcrR family transcriptional regulator [Thermoclostridium caenicola]
MRELTGMQEKILDKALYLIGKNASFDIPVRAIAKEADVNVSAINYYFRTKNEMMKYVKEFYINNTIAAYAALDDESYSDEEKVIIVANEIMEYTIKYPGVLIILREAIKNQNTNELDARIVEITDSLNKKLYHTLARVLKTDEPDAQYGNMVFLSSIIHPIMNMEINHFKESIINSKEERLKYIAYILDRLKSN